MKSMEMGERGRGGKIIIGTGVLFRYVLASLSAHPCTRMPRALRPHRGTEPGPHPARVAGIMVVAYRMISASCSVFCPKPDPASVPASAVNLQFHFPGDKQSLLLRIDPTRVSTCVFSKEARVSRLFAKRRPSGTFVRY
jgi:hypothetical protein